VGQARPAPEARNVTAKMCRALLQLPNLTDEEAGSLLDQMYGVADVCVEAFIEQHGRPAAIANAEHEPLTELGNEALASVIHAV
jgi:hypothetical protein